MTAAKTKAKPKKPRNSPLTVNGNGQFSKVINGRTEYFGPWDDHEGAVKRYLAFITKSELPESTNPEDGMTIQELCNRWLGSQDRKVQSKELSPRTFNDYLKMSKRLVDHFGKGCPVDTLQPEDFGKYRAKLAKRFKSLGSLRREITMTRTAFRFGEVNRHIRPAWFGSEFSAPTTKQIEKQRKSKQSANGDRTLEAKQIRELLGIAGPALRAMILLGINCGLGNSDIRNVKTQHIKRNWLEFPRPKTGEDRRSKLWSETLTALSEYERPKPKTGVNQRLLFITKYGNPWGESLGTGCPVTDEFRKLLDQTGLYRPGLSFYSLRHTVQTVGENLTQDTIALKLVMGHKDASISANYRASVDDERLEAVSMALRGWLFD